MKYDWSGYDYILTSKNLKYKKLASFGANMEPIESNIIYAVPGNAIKLYEIPSDYVPPKCGDDIAKITQNQEVMGHTLNRFPAKYLFQNLLARIKRKLFRK